MQCIGHLANLFSQPGELLELALRPVEHGRVDPAGHPGDDALVSVLPQCPPVPAFRHRRPERNIARYPERVRGEHLCHGGALVSAGLQGAGDGGVPQGGAGVWPWCALAENERKKKSRKKKSKSDSTISNNQQESKYAHHQHQQHPSNPSPCRMLKRDEKRREERGQEKRDERRRERR